MAVGKRFYTLIAALLFALGSQGFAAEVQPWLGNLYEFEWRNSLKYQQYSNVASPFQLVHYSSSDLFLTSSLSNTLAPEFSLEGEVTAANTRRQSGGIDHFSFTGRYLWLDDIAGDPISLVTGASFSQAFVPALEDVSSFHHGRSEAEFFLSVGKEIPCGDVWMSRSWGMLGFGVAERGSPWVRTILAYEQRFCQRHELRGKVETLWGMGHGRLRPHHFHGYGSIQHQSVDFAVRYAYLIDFFGSVDLEYSYRVYARNFPDQTQCLKLSLLMTFGLCR